MKDILGFLIIPTILILILVFILHLKDVEENEKIKNYISETVSKCSDKR